MTSSGVHPLAERELDSLGGGHGAELKRVADRHPGDVGRDALGDRGRQGLDRDLVGDVLEHAALLDAGRLLGPEQLDRHLGLDHLVELDLEQVEVDQRASHRVALLLLDHDRGGRGAVELDVDQRAAVGEHRARLALGHLERACLLAGAVDDARNEPGAAQAAARSRAELGALLDLQRGAIRSHGGIGE